MTRRYVVVATWECASDTDALEVRDTLVGIGAEASIQILQFDGAVLTGVTSDLNADAQETAWLLARAKGEPLPPIPETTARRYVHLEAMTRQLPEPSADARPGWQGRLLSRLDDARERLLTAAHETLVQLERERGGTLKATPENFLEWGASISDRLSDPGAERISVEIGQPTAALKAQRQVRIRALGVEVTYPPTRGR